MDNGITAVTIVLVSSKVLFDAGHYQGPKLKVAIIGAGLAGMSTAVELLDQGHEIEKLNVIIWLIVKKKKRIDVNDIIAWLMMEKEKDKTEKEATHDRIATIASMLKVKYNGYLEEKYGKERSEHPKFDDDLWYRASGGKNKGKVYELGNVRDPHVHGREDLKIEKLNLVIKELVKENDEDKERFEGIIAGLVTEKEKDNADKKAMLNRMTQIEAM